VRDGRFGSRCTTSTHALRAGRGVLVVSRLTNSSRGFSVPALLKTLVQ
jgi:hypothetical protein